jgi:chromosome segregation ATPase
MEKICDERHKGITEKLSLTERRLNNHGERIDKLEQGQSEFRVEIKNLCKDIQNLTSILKWFIGLLVGSYIAFFFYAVQQKLF